MGLTRLQPGACCGCSASCTTTICVTGCNATPLSGASVTIRSGGATVASGTTTSPAGCVTLTIPSAGSYTVVVSATGFTTDTSTQSLACGGTTTIALNVDAVNYTCGCAGGGAWPNGNLSLTDSIIGACTLAYDSTLGQWSGGIEWNYPGCTGTNYGCGAFTGTNVYGVSYTFDGCTLTITGPANINGANQYCPAFVGSTTTWATGNNVTAPSWTANVTDIDSSHHLYCGRTATITITG